MIFPFGPQRSATQGDKLAVFPWHCNKRAGSRAYKESDVSPWQLDRSSEPPNKAPSGAALAARVPANSPRRAQAHPWRRKIKAAKALGQLCKA